MMTANGRRIRKGDRYLIRQHPCGPAYCIDRADRSIKWFMEFRGDQMNVTRKLVALYLMTTTRPARKAYKARKGGTR